MMIKRCRFAKIAGRCLLAGLSALLLSSPDIGRAQESTFLFLIGRWNHLETGQSIDVRRTGDVWQTGGPQARVQSGVIDHGGDFAFEGVDNDRSPYRCVYKINFLNDGTTNWRKVFQSGKWTCPSGKYVREAGWLNAAPPNVLAFKGDQSGSFSPSDLYVRLVAEGYGVQWSIQSNSANWLSVTPTQGELAADGSAEVRLGLLPTAKTMEPGTYDATLTFRGAGASLGIVQRTVRLVVSKTAARDVSPDQESIKQDQELTDAQLGAAIRDLNELLGPASGRVRVGLQGGNTLRIGRKYRLEAETRIEGRLVILDVDADHKVTLIYPNKYLAQDDIGRVEAEARVSIPADNYPGALRAFQAVEPVGKGLLLAFVAPEDFHVDRMIANQALRRRGLVPVDDGQSYLLSFIDQIKTWLAQKSRTSEGLSKELQRWSFSVTEYEIVR